MRCLARNKREIHICEKIGQNQNGVMIYGRPEKILVNFRPTSTIGGLEEIGLAEESDMKIICDKKYLVKFKNGNKCFIDKEIPEEYDQMCEQANYIVTGEPKDYLNNCEISLVKIL